MELPLDQSTFWTDSTSVLKYIKNEDRRFHTFVANRVSMIRDATHVSQWRYINTKDNPADYASRGMKVGDLLTGGSWIEGPRFLFDPERDWPSDITDATIAADDVEVKRDATVRDSLFRTCLMLQTSSYYIFQIGGNLRWQLRGFSNGRGSFCS